MDITCKNDGVGERKRKKSGIIFVGEKTRVKNGYKFMLCEGGEETEDTVKKKCGSTVLRGVRNKIR